MPNLDDLDKVFVRLKKIFVPYAKRMEVADDTATSYMLNTHYVMKNKRPLCFGGVSRGKNYVSFHLMSVYVSPQFVKQMSPALRKRMQGKSCFNFKSVDEELFGELAALTKAGAKKFSDEKFIDTLRQSQAR
jgi:hypothetical protein